MQKIKNLSFNQVKNLSFKKTFVLQGVLFETKGSVEIPSGYYETL